MDYRSNISNRVFYSPADEGGGFSHQSLREQQYSVEEEFFGYYPESGQKEIPLKALDDIGGIQRLNAHVREVAIGEAISAQRLSNLRFIG